MKPILAIPLALMLLVGQNLVTPIRASSATLTITPATSVLPRVDMGEGSMCFEVALRIANAQSLKQLHLNFSYNPSVVELVEGKLDERFLSLSGGSTGDEFNFLLANPFSGSGVLGRYVFRMVGSGNTTISLSSTFLIDASGSPILLTIQGSSIRILRVGDYSYFVHIVESQLNELQESYDVLDSQYAAKSQEYEELQSQYDGLTDIYNSLDGIHDQLESAYQSLSDSYSVSQTDNAALEAELRNTRNILLVAVAGIVVLAIIIYQKVLRR